MDAAHTPAARMMQDQPRADNVILPDALPRRHFISSHLLLIAKAEGLFSPGHMLYYASPGGIIWPTASRSYPSISQKLSAQHPDTIYTATREAKLTKIF